MPINITIPGSKSIANRALILNFLGKNKTQITNLPDCDDTKFLENALEQISNSPTTEELALYTGNAGTTTRFLTALSPLLERKITIDGNQRMKERPIKELTTALIKLGARIDCPSGCPPLTISAQIPKGGEVEIKGNISSQYLSAILMTSPFYKSDTQITVKEELYSKPYIKITLELIKKFGLQVQNHNYLKFSIPGNQKISPPNQFTVESDASNASYFGAYAALNPGHKITLNTISRSSIQGDIKFLEYLEKMGCQIKEENGNTSITGPKELKSLGEIDFNSTPDLVMTFAVLALFCKEPTLIKNIGNLRIKETDRIAAMENELQKLNARTESGKDYLKITPPKTINPDPIAIKTYDDHRIAMCFAIMTKRYPNISIENPECVSKSYPSFWTDFEKIKNL